MNKVTKYLTIGMATLLIASSAFAEKISIDVQGMVCAFCAQGIKRSLLKVPGITLVEPDLANKKVEVTTEKSGQVTDEVLKRIITDAGYNVVTIERKK